METTRLRGTGKKSPTTYPSGSGRLCLQRENGRKSWLCFTPLSPLFTPKIREIFRWVGAWNLNVKVWSFICTDHLKQKENDSKYFISFYIIANIPYSLHETVKNYSIYVLQLKLEYIGIPRHLPAGKGCCVCLV